MEKAASKESLSVISLENKLYYFQLLTRKRYSKVLIFESSDGYTFSPSRKKFIVENLKNKHELLKNLTSLALIKEGKEYFAIFSIAKKSYTVYSKDGFVWRLDKLLPKTVTSITLTYNYLFQNKRVLYWTNSAVNIGISKDNQSWILYDDPIFTPPSNLSPHLLNTIVTDEEIFLLYTSTPGAASLYLVAFSRSDPRIITRRFSYPLWLEEESSHHKAKPLGLTLFKNQVFSFWQKEGSSEITCVRHLLLEKLLKSIPQDFSFLTLKKSPHNPILSPDRTNNWESQAVFNPAALYDEKERKIHLLYRAVGDDWRSVFGYAVTSDGIHIESKDDKPAYVPRVGFEGCTVSPDPNSPFSSGPGIGGCEDPRLTKIADRVYLTYVAYNGVSGPRSALSSISYADFINHNWNWSEPVLITKPDVIDKNACIFPEKIKGKYALLHRVFPNILLDYVDSLHFDGQTFLKGEYKIEPRVNGWDSRKVGAGPPPLKTPYGWLLIYHAVDNREGNKYHIGAMLLDLNDPTQVFHRSSNPIVSPTHWYENEGHKSGVVYPCGAVVIDDILHMYYGGADTHVCHASTYLPEFLDQLMHDQSTTITHINTN